MKKIVIVLLVFGIITGTVSAADSQSTLALQDNSERAENSGLNKAASLSWGRIGQRVIVGVSGLLLSQIAVEKLGSERVFGIAFGLSAAAVIRVPLIVGINLAGGLPVLASDDGVKGIAINVGQLLLMAGVNNAVESRQDCLGQLNAVVSQKK